MRKTKFLKYGLLALAALGAALAHFLQPAGEMQLTPFIHLINLSSFGADAFVYELFRLALPLVPFGILLPIAAPKLNNLLKALPLALGFPLLLSLIGLLFGRAFVTDEPVYGAFGVLSGFSLYMLVAYVLRARKVFSPVPTKKAMAVCCAFLAVVYFGIATTSLLEQESIVVPPPTIPEYPLPSPVISDFEFPNIEKIAIYEQVRYPDATARAKEFAALLFGSDTLDADQSTFIGYELRYSGQTLLYKVEDEWDYSDELGIAAGLAKDVPDAAECERIVREFLAKEGVLTTEVGTLSSIENKYIQPVPTDEDGGEDAPANVDLPLTARLLHFTGILNGCALHGTGDIQATIGNGGAIVKLKKSGPDFKFKKNVSIISARAALELALSGQVEHNLYSRAQSATIDSVELAYKLEDTAGNLLPIWLFRGSARMEDGTDEALEIYVNAMK